MTPGEIANFIATACILIYWVLQKRGDKTSAQLEELARRSDRLDELVRRVVATEKHLATLESTLKSSPRHDDLSRMYSAINELSKTVNQLVGESTAQGKFLNTLINRLTEKGLQ
jgi:ABC-type transporter Mla subunit MlaD